MPAVIETCTRLNFPMQFLDNSANYGLKRMADDRVDMLTILQKEHATFTNYGLIRMGDARVDAIDDRCSTSNTAVDPPMLWWSALMV